MKIVWYTAYCVNFWKVFAKLAATINTVVIAFHTWKYIRKIFSKLNYTPINSRQRTFSQFLRDLWKKKGKKNRSIIYRAKFVAIFHSRILYYYENWKIIPHSLGVRQCFLQIFFSGSFISRSYFNERVIKSGWSRVILFSFYDFEPLDSVRYYRQIKLNFWTRKKVIRQHIEWNSFGNRMWNNDSR